MSGPELIIFDCDGVIIDSEIISAQQLIDALAPMGIDIDLDFVARNFLGRSYPMVMEEIRRAFGVNLPPSFEDEYRARLLAAFERDLKIIPHVAEVIESLDRPFCLATSSSPARAARSLEIVGMAQAFSKKVYTASLVAKGKPAPDLFLHVAAEFGVEPAHCLVIEDSLNGVRAAKSAGMPVWRFIGGSHLQGRALEGPEGATAELTFASFTEFAKHAPWFTPKGKAAQNE
ncbi:MAG: HAD superfamily hydrolase (TIGR01509 family) [Halocynthiibacter sp.]|jgi:HAD superfamily hydrolase (TIGR01509 family)